MFEFKSKRLRLHVIGTRSESVTLRTSLSTGPGVPANLIGTQMGNWAAMQHR